MPTLKNRPGNFVAKLADLSEPVEFQDREQGAA
jgi:hypothetical protein